MAGMIPYWDGYAYQWGFGGAAPKMPSGGAMNPYGGAYGAQSSGGFDPFAGLGALSRNDFGPKTGQEIVAEMNAAHATLPAELQLGAAQIDAAAIEQAKQAYLQSVRPDEEKLFANQIARGRENSTFGGAELGQMKAENLRNAYYASQDAIDRALDRWKSKRQAYFGARGGEGGTVSSDRGGSEYASWMLGAANARNQARRTDLEYMDFKRQGSKDKWNKWGAIAEAGIGGLQMAGPWIAKGVNKLWNMMPHPGGGYARKATPPTPYWSTMSEDPYGGSF